MEDLLLIMMGMLLVILFGFLQRSISCANRHVKFIMHSLADSENQTRIDISTPAAHIGQSWRQKSIYKVF